MGLICCFRKSVANPHPFSRRLWSDLPLGLPSVRAYSVSVRSRKSGPSAFPSRNQPSLSVSEAWPVRPWPSPACPPLTCTFLSVVWSDLVRSGSIRTRKAHTLSLNRSVGVAVHPVAGSKSMSVCLSAVFPFPLSPLLRVWFDLV